MPVMVVADLHLDFWLHEKRDPFATVDAELLRSLDALIVAGDLTNKPKKRWPRMLEHIGRYVPLNCVHVFPGNHDFYDHVLDDEERLGSRGALPVLRGILICTGSFCPKSV